MKCLSAILIATAALSLPSAYGQLLFQEGFNYTSGSSLGGSVNPGNGQAWIGSNAGLTIGSGDLTYSGLENISVNDLSMQWGTAGTSVNTFANVTSGSVFYSFLLQMTTDPGGNDYVTSLNPGTTPPGGSADALAVYVQSGTSAGEIGIRTAGEATTHVGSSLAMALDTTYLVVVQYNFATTTASLWLDPTLSSAPPTPTLTLAGSGTVTAIDDVGFKSQATTGGFLVDNLLVGETWGDVTPGAAPVPEPSCVALIGAGLALIGAIRFRRQ